MNRVYQKNGRSTIEPLAPILSAIVLSHRRRNIVGANVLIIGSGGREHALAWKVARSPKVEMVFIAPGNAGTAAVGENVPIPASDIDRLAAFAAARQMDLTVVGPDDPLAAGIVDRFREFGLRIFGPTAGAAAIETSKAFAKTLMAETGIPTAEHTVAHRHDEALEIARRCIPVVIKADGLAQGKGVFICRTVPAAEDALHQLMVTRRFGAAADSVVIEELVEGNEISLHALCDGRTTMMFPAAQDHKAALDGGLGPNTGGMGAVAPVPYVDGKDLAAMRSSIVEPALRRLGEPFTGCLFPGVMLTPRGPKILEYNARFGDPETQCYMRLLKSDLFDLLWACTEGTLERQKVVWYKHYAVCVVLASAGYPGPSRTGVPIVGIKRAERIKGVTVFHAGTARHAANDGLVTAGGRVLGVTATGKTLRAAIVRAYRAAAMIRFDGMRYRTDIGAEALAYQAVRRYRKLAEGKTKIIREIPGTNEVLIESKDDITAGDGARRHSFPGKGALSTTTAVNALRYLASRGIPTHFVAQEDDRTFRARRCAMIPIELVARRLAAGSYLKRRPEFAEGTRFDELVIEFFLKDDARHDPLMVLDPRESVWRLHDAKKPLDEGLMGEMSLYDVKFGADKRWCLDHIFVERLKDRARASFLALEEAWDRQAVTLVDLKIECGVALEDCELLVADVVDNDAWRIWPGGDKTLMKDKQVYRDLATVTPEALETVRANYAWVAEATARF
jgi:phosphoribosylamine--glycine ligase